LVDFGLQLTLQIRIEAAENRGIGGLPDQNSPLARSLRPILGLRTVGRERVSDVVRGGDLPGAENLFDLVARHVDARRPVLASIDEALDPFLNLLYALLHFDEEPPDAEAAAAATEQEEPTENEQERHRARFLFQRPAFEIVIVAARPLRR